MSAARAPAFLPARPLGTLRVLCACLALLLWAVAAQAQEDGPDFEGWAETVAGIETQLDDPDLPDATLEALRQQLSVRRQQFLDAENTNRLQIERVTRQIETLGPAPPAGEPEPDAVAERRSALADELSNLQQPVVRAREAYVEADALVAEIDRILRNREAERAFTRSPTPLNPINWITPLADLKALLLALPREAAATMSDPERRATVRAALPGAALLALFGAWFLFRAPYWLDRYDSYMARFRTRPMVLFLHGTLALLQLGLPLVGVVLLIGSVDVSGIFGEVGSAVSLALMAFAATMIVGIWLVRRLFPEKSGAESPLMLASGQLRRGRLASRLMVLGLALYQGIDALATRAELDPLTSGYMKLVVGIVVAVTLVRLARLFKASAKAGETPEHEEDAAGFYARVVSVLASVAIVVSVAAVGAGLAGYLALAEKLVFPAAVTFLLFGLLALMQKAFAGLLASMAHRDRAAEDSLLPTLFGAVCLLASVPLLALLWGMRATDLLELSRAVWKGFDVGGVRISPTIVFRVVVVFGLLLLLTRLIQGALKTTILPKTSIDKGGRNAIVAGVGYVGVFVALIAALSGAGINLSNLAILASALAVGIGFGLQTIVSNFVSGIILLIERPVSEGDWIEVAGQMGYVRAISVRATRIETFDRTDVIVPNSDLISGHVTNWTRGNLIGRVIVPVGVAYGSDTRHVERVLKEIAEAQPMVVLTPPPQVLFMGFADSAMKFEIRAILRDINFMLSVTSDINHEIARRFAEEGIEIPFPQRDLHLRSSALEPAAPAAPVPAAAREPAPARPLQPARPDVADSDGDGDGR